MSELATRIEPFRSRWAAHTIRALPTGVRPLHHPVVGDLALSFEAMDLRANPGLDVLAFSAEPGSPTEDALRLLGSWPATATAEPQPSAG